MRKYLKSTTVDTVLEQCSLIEMSCFDTGSDIKIHIMFFCMKTITFFTVMCTGFHSTIIVELSNGFLNDFTVIAHSHLLVFCVCKHFTSILSVFLHHQLQTPHVLVWLWLRDKCQSIENLFIWLMILVWVNKKCICHIVETVDFNTCLLHLLNVNLSYAYLIKDRFTILCYDELI